MKLRHLVASGVFGLSALVNSSNGAVINVPTDDGVLLQDYIDLAQPGDTLNIVYGTHFPQISLYGSAIIDKDLTIEGNGWMLGNPTSGNTSPLITITSLLRSDPEHHLPTEPPLPINSAPVKVTLNNIFFSMPNSPYKNLIEVQDSSSLEITNSELNGSWTGGRLNSLYFNSTGDLTASNNIFHGSSSSSGINLEKIVGNIDIQLNEIRNGTDGIVVGSDAEGNSSTTLNIVNNTIYGYSGSGISLSSMLSNATGMIANNSITDGSLGIENPLSSGNVLVTNNNSYNNSGEVGEVSLSSLKDGISIQSTGVNYSLDPKYVNASLNNFNLQPDSELYGKGLFVDGYTTWFPSQDNTWIGAYGIPEPSTSLIIGAGLVGLLAGRKR